MIFPTRFGDRTEFPDDAVQSVFRTAIYRLTSGVEQYGLKEGTVLLANRDQDLWHIHEMGLDSALRACCHATSGYGWSASSGDKGELAELSEFVAGNRHLWHMLLDWGRMEPADRILYEEQCSELAARFERVRNPHKLLARERTAKAATVTDSLGRTNPVSRMTLQAWAAREVEMREKEVHAIAMRVDMRRVYLVQQIERNLAVLRRVRESLDLLAREISIRVRTPEQARGSRGLLLDLAAQLRKTHDLPWRHVSRRSAQDLVWAERRLREGKEFDLRMAARHVERAQKSLRMLGQHRILADLQLSISLALARRPRKAEELEYMLEELERYRASIRVGVDRDFRNPIMTRVRKAVNRAIAEWRAANYKEARLALRGAAEPF